MTDGMRRRTRRRDDESRRGRIEQKRALLALSLSSASAAHVLVSRARLPILKDLGSSLCRPLAFASSQSSYAPSSSHTPHAFAPPHTLAPHLSLRLSCSHASSSSPSLLAPLLFLHGSHLSIQFCTTCGRPSRPYPGAASAQTPPPPLQPPLTAGRRPAASLVRRASVSGDLHRSPSTDRESKIGAPSCPEIEQSRRDDVLIPVG
jgi:hypothetical protein